MLQWKRSGGKEFVFFQSHPGFAFGNENVTKEFYDKIMCREMGDALHIVVERGQRWKCPTYREGAPFEFRFLDLKLMVQEHAPDPTTLLCA